MAMGAKSEGGSAGESLRLRFDAYELDEADARLTRDGQPVPLAPRPFAVLCALARTPRTLVTKNALLDAVWGHRFVSDSVLKTTVSALRAALDDNPKEPRYIETVSRRGYRFIGAVSAPSAPVASVPAAASAAATSDGAPFDDRPLRGDGTPALGMAARRAPAGAASYGWRVSPAWGRPR